MKKTYINPEMEVVVMKMNNSLLAGSDTLPKGSETITDPNDILAPDFDFMFEK